MKEDLKQLKRFFMLFRPHWLSYCVSTVMVSSRNLIITWLTAFISSRVLEVVAQSENIHWLREIGLFLVLLCVFALFDTVGVYLQTVSIQKISNRLRSQLYHSMLFTSMQEAHGLGQRSELIVRMNQDVDSASMLLSFGLLMPLMYLISGIGATIIIGRESLFICIGLYLLGIMGLFIHIKIAKSSRGVLSDIKKSTTTGLSMYQQTLSRSADIRMAGLSRPTFSAFLKEMRVYRRIGQRDSALQGAAGGFEETIRYVGFFGTVGFSLYLYSVNAISLSGVVLVSQMASLILTMILMIFSSITSVQTSLAGLDRIFEVIGLPPEDTGGSELCVQNEKSETELVFASNVKIPFENGNSLSYPDILIPANCIVALTGESGRGKTTLIRALLKFCPYRDGSLQLFGNEISECSAFSIRNTMGYVSQENAIFSGTLRENLLLGNHNERISDADIWEVLKEIGAVSWISSLQEGLDAVLAEGGGNLSGGQRQMIAIARVILLRRQIMILDEAFAGIDKDHISQIISYIRRLADTHSVIIITHDGQVTAQCDKQVQI